MNALRVAWAIWLREVKLFVRERSRIVGMIGQPLLYLLILGQGLAGGLHFVKSEPGVGYLQFMYPGVVCMSVLFTSIFSAVSIIWDREFGFLKEVLVSPAPRSAVAAGKVLGGATVAAFQSAILLALAPVVGVSLSAVMVVEVLLLCFLISCAMTSLGVAVAARMRSMQGFQMLMNFLVMPMYFLSGAMFPVTRTTAEYPGTPEWMKWLMAADPLTYGVNALRAVMFPALASVQAGPDPPAAGIDWFIDLIARDIRVDLAVLGATALLLGGLAAYLFSTTD